MGVRGKLFLVSFALILTVGAVTAIYIESVLRERLQAETRGQLADLARVGVEMARDRPPGALDALADRLARASAARFTFVDGSGHVLGDSALDGEALAEVENHAGRPEIRAALAGQEGVARRESATTGAQQLYVAVPAEGLVIRASKPLTVLDDAIAGMHLMLLIACGLGLGLAALVSALASHVLTRPVRDLLANARAIAEGSGRPITIRAPDELGGLATSLNRLGTALRDEVEALAGERDRMEAVLEGIAEAVLAVDADRRVTLINHAGLALLRLDQAPLGRPLLEAIRSPELHDAVIPALAGEPAQLELELPGEPTRHVLARITPQRSGGGAVVVMHDVTRLRRLETIRRDFVANVSHELRTPVTVLRANAETLLDGALEDPARARIFVQAMLRNAERLAQLVTDLLDITRIESGKYEINLVAAPVVEVAGRAAESVEQLVEEKSMSLRFDIDEGLCATADEQALEQVLVNLLSNAVKYTPPRGHVEVWARRQGDVVRIEVRDDGPGIPAEHRERVFERFYRVDTGRSKAMGGTGLGLSIVKHLVGAMGGRVGVFPSRPRGTTFFVELPAEGVEAVKPQTPTTRPPAAASG